MGILYGMSPVDIGSHMNANLFCIKKNLIISCFTSQFLFFLSSFLGARTKNQRYVFFMSLFLPPSLSIPHVSLMTLFLLLKYAVMNFSMR